MILFEPMKGAGKTVDRHAERFVKSVAAGRQMVKVGEYYGVAVFSFDKTSCLQG